jgi:hypothetical protein
VLFLGNDYPLDGDEPAYSGVDFNTNDYTHPYAHLDTKGDKILTDRALKRITSHPSDFAFLTTKKFFRYFLGSTKGYVFPSSSLSEAVEKSGNWFQTFMLLLNPIVQISVVVMGVLSGIHILIARNQSLKAFAFYALLIILYFGALHAPAFPIPRLFLPTFPFFVALLALGLTRQTAVSILVPGLSIAASLLIYFWLPNPDLKLANTSSHTLELFDKKVPVFVVGHKDINPITGTILGSDSWFLLDVPSASATRAQMFGVDLDVACPKSIDALEGALQLFWAAKGEAFSESRSVSAPISSSADAALLRPALHPQWSGVLTSLRLDMPAEFQSCTVKVQSVGIYR